VGEEGDEPQMSSRSLLLLDWEMEWGDGEREVVGDIEVKMSGSEAGWRRSIADVM